MLRDKGKTDSFDSDDKNAVESMLPFETTGFDLFDIFFGIACNHMFASGSKFIKVSAVYVLPL